jgi:SagB-type dehydrogenase family enzyme
MLLTTLLIKTPYIFHHQEILAAANDTIALEEPLSSVNMDLIEALKLRRSTKKFAKNQIISNKELSTILWAANGINRTDGKRTAPSAFGKYFINIYVAADQGFYRYEPEKHHLMLISNQNVKSKLAGQKFVADASHVLVIIANIKEFPFFVKNEDRIACANATAGCIGENVYLTANALNLDACLMSSIDRKYIQENLSLSENELPLFIMPVGHPK